MNSQIKKPSITVALITFLSIIITISVGVFFSIPLHSILLICLLIAGISIRLLGGRYLDFQTGMSSGIQKALPTIYIFIMMGIIIASFIDSGTIPTLLYYGLHFIHPDFFLPICLLVCTVMSVATGTSWGTIGTVGIIFLSIGHSMNFSTATVAGAIVSGACFGDKMSPVSDTTSLAAMCSEIELNKHIKSMCYTTIPVYIITFIFLTFYGYGHHSQNELNQQVLQLTQALEHTFNLSLWTLLPIVVLLTLSIRHIKTELAMFIASFIAVLLAIFIQQKASQSVLGNLLNGSHIESGTNFLDTLLNRGGIISMMPTLSLSLMAMALGGVLEKFGFLSVLIEKLLSYIQRPASLVSSTIAICFTGNLTMGEVYISIILAGQLFKKAYDKKNIDRSILSRSLEEGATLTTALIPWTTAGAFITATLNVPVLEYAPWAILNWLNPLFSIVLAYVGIIFLHTHCKKTSPTNKTES